MYPMTQFSAVLEQCAIKNETDVYSVVMVIVKHRKYLQTCHKNSRKVPGSTLTRGCFCQSVATMQERRSVLTFFRCLDAAAGAIGWWTGWRELNLMCNGTILHAF